MYPLSHDHHPPPNRVTPNGVGLLPESQARHSQRVQPALSVTAAPCQLSHRESQGAGNARPMLLHNKTACAKMNCFPSSGQ